MTVTEPRAARTDLIRALTRVERVFVIPVSADGQLLLLRHELARGAYWTFPTVPRTLPRMHLAPLARKLTRDELGVEPTQLRLVAVLEPSRAHGRAAVYAAEMPGTGTQIITNRASHPIRRHPLQAMTFTADTLAVLDVRPIAITALLTSGGDPARNAMQLPDLLHAATSGQDDR
ncbi:hypothetical protein [Catellatospora chokoriensis]|uniref:Uncharacterized protein n=1 Tax=Catellatospora chokoriensis TaxID=310353 RepID=A0A8J3K342_9ACTN|nr:hypothetical protein [Catellatospora chokoriensis]GIF89835.1 hypothetical protein Cch02nite_32790 [Catellatospora chokoriensis]